MAHYMEDARRLHDTVEDFLTILDTTTGKAVSELPEVVTSLGHLINAAVLCNPRKPQGAVRRNIVAEAMRGRCDVSMTKEPYTRRDGRTGTYNKIHITAK